MREETSEESSSSYNPPALKGSKLNSRNKGKITKAIHNAGPKNKGETADTVTKKKDKAKNERGLNSDNEEDAGERRRILFDTYSNGFFIVFMKHLNQDKKSPFASIVKVGQILISCNVKFSHIAKYT